MADEYRNAQGNVKVSVIIPAYNCVNVIGETIKSVQQQKLKEIEVIILNDGSTDNTLSEVEKLTVNDHRFKILTLTNGGPAKARNIGITNSVGEYIYFLDSDDIIHENMLYDMYELAKSNGLDVCACGYQMERVSGDKITAKEFSYSSFVAITAKDFRDKLMPLIKAHLMYAVWNKLFDRMFIVENHIEFTDFLSGEDRLFNIQTYKFIERFGFIDKVYYRYFLRGKESLANKYISNRFEATLKAHIDLIMAYKNMDIYTQKNKKYIEFVFIKGVMACFCQMFLKACPYSKEQKYAYIRTTINTSWVREASQSYDEEFVYSKHINRILRKGNVKTIYYTAKAIYIGQTKFNDIYQSLKHGKKKA